MKLGLPTLVAVAGICCACDDTSYYLYTGYEYDPARDCLHDVEALDVDIGSDPGSSCDAKCLAAADFDGGTSVYATTMCGPTPEGADATGTDPSCAPALAALARSDFCLDDASGSTNPLDASTE